MMNEGGMMIPPYSSRDSTSFVHPAADCGPFPGFGNLALVVDPNQATGLEIGSGAKVELHRGNLPLVDSLSMGQNGSRVKPWTHQDS